MSLSKQKDDEPMDKMTMILGIFGQQRGGYQAWIFCDGGLRHDRNRQE